MDPSDLNHPEDIAKQGAEIEENCDKKSIIQASDPKEHNAIAHDLEMVSSAEDDEILQKQVEPDPVAENKENDAPVPEPKVETAEERLQRIKQFYDTEFARTEFDTQGSRNCWTLIKYEDYYIQQCYGKDFGGSHHNSGGSHLNSKKQDPKNAKIAEYFGEALSSDEDVDQLIQQFSQSNVTAGGQEQISKQDVSSRFAQDNAVVDTNIIGKIEPIPEEDEEGQVEDSKKLTKTKSKRKSSSITSTKVSIRHLPKSMRKEEFLDAIGPLPDHTFINYTPGNFLSKVCNRRMTGYCNINFVKQEDADAFVSAYRIFILRDEKGNECFASTDFAISQRIPKNSSSTVKVSKDLMDMENDNGFLEFKKLYESTTGIVGKPVNVDGQVTTEVMIREIESRTQNKNELLTTPLLSYIMQQSLSDKDKKFGNLLKKSSEKSRISIKKENKRDRRDRKEKKEIGRNKDPIELKHKDRQETAKTKSTTPSKAENPMKSDPQSKMNRKHDTQSNRLLDQKGDEKPSKQSKPGAGSTATDKKSSKEDALTKQTGSSRKSDRTQADKIVSVQSPKRTKNINQSSKNSEGISKSEGQSSSSSQKTDRVENVGKVPGDDENVPGKKKIVKKIVKVKRIVKSKSSEAGPSELKLDAPVKEEGTRGPANALRKPATDSKAGTGESEAPVSSEAKRTKKARPDMQIYRPGSLRSSKNSDPNKGAGDSTNVQKQDKQKNSDNPCGLSSKSKVKNEESNAEA